MGRTNRHVAEEKTQPEGGEEDVMHATHANDAGQSTDVEDRKRRKKAKRRAESVAAEAVADDGNDEASPEERKEGEEEEERLPEVDGEQPGEQPQRRKDRKRKKADDDEVTHSVGEAADESDSFDLASLKKANKSTSAAAPSSASTSPSASGSGLGTRVFLGNLSFKVTDEVLVAHFASCGSIEGLHYVTDRTTGKFYGSAFLDFATPDAARAALALNGSDVLGRPLKVGYATGAHASGANRYNSKESNGAHLSAAPVSAKPEGTTTVFLGNLSFQVDEDAVRAMFAECGDIAAVRWVEKDGVFKGCGFVEFGSTEATDAAVRLNGRELLGRPVRVDYSATNSAKRERER